MATKVFVTFGIYCDIFRIMRSHPVSWETNSCLVVELNFLLCKPTKSIVTSIFLNIRS